MIGSLRGVLTDRRGPGEVVVDIGGVGYLLSVPASTDRSLGAVGSEVVLDVHTHVREDAIVLFGFSRAEERRTFEALLGAHGVGPTLALAIVSSLSPEALAVAVLEDDLDTLCRVPGVGKKTAARLLLELKARLDAPVPDPAGGASSTGERPVRGETRAALAELGYGPEEVRAALDMIGDAETVEELLRAALRQLATTR